MSTGKSDNHPHLPIVRLWIIAFAGVRTDVTHESYQHLPPEQMLPFAQGRMASLDGIGTDFRLLAWHDPWT